MHIEIWRCLGGGAVCVCVCLCVCVCVLSRIHIAEPTRVGRSSYGDMRLKKKSKCVHADWTLMTIELHI